MTFMTIGEFAARTRLSPKALRLYDRLGLLTPARLEASSGYRLYGEDQVAVAQLVGLLRRLDMPLAVIADVLAAHAGAGAELAADGGAAADTDAGADAGAGAAARSAADVVARYWQQVEADTAERRALAGYLQARLSGGNPPMYDIQTRAVPRRTLLAISAHVHLDGTDAFFGDAFARLRSAGPGLPGIAGIPFLIFYGEVSEDSDGPLELCRPVDSEQADEAAAQAAGAERRVEPAHDEAYIRLVLKDMNWPAMLPAADALAAWVGQQNRHPAGPLRQVLIADQRTAAPETPVCDLSLPLK
jgi:DNA-binding transcriptional MerR regulator